MNRMMEVLARVPMWILFVIAGVLSIFGLAFTLWGDALFRQLQDGNAVEEIVLQGILLIFGNPRLSILFTAFFSLRIMSLLWFRFSTREARIGMTAGWILFLPIALYSIFFGGLIIVPVLLWMPATILLLIGEIAGCFVGVGIKRLRR